MFFRDQDLHWRRQRRDGAIILTDKRLIHVAILDPGYPGKVLLVVRPEKAGVPVGTSMISIWNVGF